MKSIAPKNLPENIQNAINILWEYSADAIYTYRTKEQVFKDGFEVNTDTCFVLELYFDEKEGD